ncbi:hypothetical protein B7982_10615 [Fibrobacter sp. UWB2]|uniref:sugar-transfer associated ATP-grasp domain-containing protein n=1 Tax=Fibrobacter sp. UWB2 TaxID=1964358 RepID=UPI000B52842E|nr:sugar-transfer associated ATP-grasp domain-containing protein [Fibrobacter sp. UWB2]OWV21557.1 hypothetical protein B7982_10615 [Fibrobacter sp. UWB2]
MKQLVENLINGFVAKVKKAIYLKQGKSWCKKAKVNGCRLYKPNNKLYKKYQEKWGLLETPVMREYLEVFCAYLQNDEDRLNIVPENICHNVIEPVLNPFRYRVFFEDKNYFAKILGKDILPNEFLRCINGTFYDGDYNCVATEDLPKKMGEIAAIAPHIIVKPTVDSCSGNGIHFFKWNGQKFENDKGNSFEQILLNGKIKNFVVQEVLKQSDFISQFGPTSVNTLRIVTYKSVKDECVHIPAMLLRIGKIGANVDNAHAGGLFVGINPETGELGKYVSDQYGKTQSVFNGIDFSNSNYKIPNFDKVLAFAKKVHSVIPYHRLLALDVVLMGNGCKLIEYNISAFSTWLFPFVGQTPFGKWTDEIIEYCSEKKQLQRFWLV